jgi:hypothetical protein
MQPGSDFKVFRSITRGGANTSDIPNLYQYTKAGGLLGLMKSKSLWFSHIQFQNDGAEFLHALELYREVLEQDFNLTKEEQELYIDYIPKSGNIYPVYTCSLTSKGDLLSQWRGYCPKGGYSYSLCKDLLEGMLRRHDLILVECLYEDAEKKRFIKQATGLTQNLVDEIRVLGTGGNFRAYRNRIIDIAGKFLNYAPALKHESFKEESEWRLITYHEYDGFMAGQMDFVSRRKDNIYFREGTSTLVPYLELSLFDRRTDSDTNPNPDILCFNEIIVSPNPNPELARAACGLMLGSTGISAPVKSSIIPYKNW